MANEIERVLADVRDERARQTEIWGGPTYDDQHGPGDWLDYLAEHTAKAEAQLELDGGYWYLNSRAAAEYRRRLIEVAALAVAAVESFDRADRTFPNA